MTHQTATRRRYDEMKQEQLGKRKLTSKPRRKRLLPVGTVVRLKHYPSDRLGFIAFVETDPHCLYQYYVIFHKSKNPNKFPQSKCDEEWFRAENVIECKGIAPVKVFSAMWCDEKIFINPNWHKKAFSIGHRDMPISLIMEIANWLKDYHPSVRFAKKPDIRKTRKLK